MVKKIYATAPQAQLRNRGKKKRQPSALHPAGAVPSQGVGYAVTGWIAGRPARMI